MNKIILTAFIIILSFKICLSQNTQGGQIQNYRYQLETFPGDPDKYSDELPSNTTSPHYEVETDNEGKIVRVASWRNEKKISESLYIYTGSKYYSSIELYTSGEHKGTTRYQRNEKDEPTQSDYYTTTSILTGYAIFSYKKDFVEIINNSAEGKFITKTNKYYLNRIFNHKRTFHSEIDSNYSDYQYDDKTGQLKSGQEYRSNKQINSINWSYDESGDMIRIDGYLPNGNWYAGEEYSDNLRLKRKYKMTDGTSFESQISYDDKRLEKETKMYVNDKYICKFQYDRLPDGTIKQSKAIGPEGDLYAEYPDVLVIKVDINGQNTDRVKGTIYKKGPWW